MGYDFRWQPLNDRQRQARSWFLDSILRCKQLIFDLTKSVPPPGESLLRNEGLEKDYQREEFAVKSALVILIARMDLELNEHFAVLWTARPDLLHGWISDHLPQTNPHRGGEPALVVALDHLWSGNYPIITIQEYFKAEIHKLWAETRFKPKLRALQGIVDAELPQEAVELFDQAIDERNAFVHPQPYNWPTKNEQSERKSFYLDEAWFGKVCEAFLSVQETLHKAVHDNSWRTVATNLTTLGGYMTERQRVALKTIFQNSESAYNGLDNLLKAIETTNLRRPELLVLSITDEVAGNFAMVTEFLAKYSDLPVIFLDGAFATTVRQKHIDEVEAFVKTRKKSAFVPTQTKYLEIKDAEAIKPARLKELALKYPGRPIVVSMELAEEIAGKAALLETMKALEKHKSIMFRKTRQGGGYVAYEGKEGVQYWVEKFTGVGGGRGRDKSARKKRKK